MDPRYAVSREEFYNLQMEVKQVQIAQNSYGDRILRLEKRQADDAALKSVWQAPFPGVLGGTPQQNPVPMTSNDVFDDLDDAGEHLLGSLQLGAIDDEPIRRGGAASRANSVRFDESALQGANAGWGGHNNRHSGEFGILRPGSGLMMERSLSHKSDGRHSSAGHSVHSVHSVASGRGSSLGLDTNFMVGGHDDDSPIDIPEPPPGLFVLGSVPTIIRCWLTTEFAHKTLLFADVCTGSRKSTIDYSLLKEFDLVDEIHKDLDSIYRVRLPIFLAEATVSQSHARSGSPGHRIPSITATFDVLGVDQPEHAYAKKAIRLFIGSDILRAHSADLFLSQNRMTLYADDRDKLSVPFATPDDDAVFKHIQTNSNQPEKPKLSATATPFVSGEVKSQLSTNLAEIDASLSRIIDTDTSELMTPNQLESSNKATDAGTDAGTVSEVGTEVERQIKDAETENGSKETYTSTGSVNGSDKDGGRRESATGIWGSWRAGQGTNGADGGRENGLLSGYQPPGRGNRNMKVLKPQKSSSSNSVRTGGSYEPPPSSRSSSELRRKSLITSVGQENGTAPPPLPTTQSPTVRWEAKRAMANGGGGEARAVPPPPLSTQSAQQAATSSSQGSRSASSAGLPRSANPVGGASAFSWMKPTVKGKTPTAVE